MNLRNLALTLCTAASAAGFSQSAPLKASAYSIVQVPAQIARGSNLPLKLTVVNDGRGILEARYSGCFVQYEVFDLRGKSVARSSNADCLKAAGGFTVLNQADYPFLERFMVFTGKLKKGQYQVVVHLNVEGRIGSRPLKSISSQPVKFSVV